MKKLGIALAILVVAGIVVYGTTSPGKPAGSGAASAGPGVAKGRWAAPDFNLTDLSGQPLKLSALRGKVVLLDFWATWCPPCVAEIPHFVDLHAQYKGRGLEIVGLSLDEGGPPAVRPFLQSHRVKYPIAMATPQITQAYGGIRGIPTTFLIDKAGNVARKYVGFQERAVFEREIRSLLAE